MSQVRLKETGAGTLERPADAARAAGASITPPIATIAGHEAESGAGVPSHHVEGRRESAADVAGERVLRAELVELADDQPADVVAGVAGLRQGGEQHVERPVLIGVESIECVGQPAVAAQRDPRGEPVGLKPAGSVRQQDERLVGLAAGDEDPGESETGDSVAGVELERRAQRGLVTGGDQRVGLRGDQVIEEPVDDGLRLDADELVDDLPVAERLDGRDSLDPVALGERLVGVGVDLRENGLALAGVGRGLEHGAERLARATPARPEIDDHRYRLRPLEHLLLEIDRPTSITPCPIMYTRARRAAPAAAEPSTNVR